MGKEMPADMSGFNPFGDLIGLQFVKCEGGQSRCTLEVEQRLLNPHGVVHGGVLYSMADTGMGGAMYTVMEKEELCATIEIKITYFKAVRSGTWSATPGSSAEAGGWLRRSQTSPMTDGSWPRPAEPSPYSGPKKTDWMPVFCKTRILGVQRGKDPR